MTNCIPVTLTWPEPLSTVTVPSVPWNTAKPPFHACAMVPEALVQLVARPAVQVPLPPSTDCEGVVVEPFQNWIGAPAPSTMRFTSPATEVCTPPASPPVSGATSMPLSVRLPV